MLSLGEVGGEHPLTRDRHGFVTVDGIAQPGAGAERFLPDACGAAAGRAQAGEHTRRALLDWGFAAAEIDELEHAGAVA